MGQAHTPGPWDRVPQTQGGDLIAHSYETGQQMNPKGLRLIAFMMARGNSLTQDEANANLIAAAPELLAALRDLVEIERRDNLTDPAVCATDEHRAACWANARSAISKATGQPDGGA